jgi:hypothetical protein
MIGSEKLKRNGFPQPAPQCDPLAASARSFSSVEGSGLRVRLHRIARGGRASLEQSRCTCVWQPTFSQSFNSRMSLGTILLIILILLLIGAIPSWPYGAGWGYYPSGGIRNRSDHRPHPRAGTNLRRVRGLAADVGSNRAASAAPLIRTRSVPLRAPAAVDRSSSRSARSRRGVRAVAPVLEALGPLSAHCRHSG